MQLFLIRFYFGAALQHSDLTKDTHIMEKVCRAFENSAHPQFIANWAFGERIGFYAVLRHQLDRNKPEIMIKNDKVLHEAFEYYDRRCTEALAYEELHGEGCLMDLSHPWYAVVLPALQARYPSSNPVVKKFLSEPMIVDEVPAS